MPSFKRIAAIFALIIIAFLACNPIPGTPPITVTPETKFEITAKPPKAGWEVEWDNVIAEGKKEGKLVVASSIGPEVRQPISEAFKKKGDWRKQVASAY